LRGHFRSNASLPEFDVTSRPDEYRRRARVCFEAAEATQNKNTRTALIEFGDEWLAMAASYDPPGDPTTQQQQQHQVQPKDDNEKG
jgi:hypothetical protein